MKSRYVYMNSVTGQSSKHPEGAANPFPPDFEQFCYLGADVIFEQQWLMCDATE